MEDRGRAENEGRGKGPALKANFLIYPCNIPAAKKPCSFCDLKLC